MRPRSVLASRADCQYIVSISRLLGSWHNSLWLRGRPEVLSETCAESLVPAGILLKLLPMDSEVFAFDMGSYVSSSCFQRYCSKHRTVSILHATIVKRRAIVAAPEEQGLVSALSRRSSLQPFDLYVSAQPTSSTSAGLWSLLRWVLWEDLCKWLSINNNFHHVSRPWKRRYHLRHPTTCQVLHDELGKRSDDLLQALRSCTQYTLENIPNILHSHFLQSLSLSLHENFVVENPSGRTPLDFSALKHLSLSGVCLPDCTAFLLHAVFIKCRKQLCKTKKRASNG